MSPRKLSVFAFCFFDAWLVSFAYEGQILYTLLDSRALDSAHLVRGAILAHAAGLFLCGFFVRTRKSAQNVMAVGAAVCLAGSAFFLSPAAALWPAALLSAAFAAGFWNAAWGFCYRDFFAAQERMKAAAISLAGGTLLMAVLDLAAVCLHPLAGLLLSMLCLAAACGCVLCCRRENPGEETAAAVPAASVPLGRPLALLCLFIAAVTVASGLMFQVVNPAFAHLGLLTTVYWAVPYVAAMIAAVRLPRRVNRSYLLFAALSMIGFGFLAFMVLDRSAWSYLIVDTLLLGAFGITDLFWWSILGEMLEFHPNPARIMGTGLSVNVAGVLLGESISGALRSSAPAASAAVSLASVCAAVVILPILYNRLVLLLKNSAFLQTLEEMSPEKQRQTLDSLLAVPDLTVREREITALLLKGYTYRLIAQELFISESTVKTHIQNIYSKLNVCSKTELIRRLRRP